MRLMFWFSQGSSSAAAAAGQERGVTAAWGIITEDPTRTRVTHSSTCGSRRWRSTTSASRQGAPSTAAGAASSHCSHVPRLELKKARRWGPRRRACRRRSPAAADRKPTHWPCRITSRWASRSEGSASGRGCRACSTASGSPPGEGTGVAACRAPRARKTTTSPVLRPRRAEGSARNARAPAAAPKGDERRAVKPARGRGAVRGGRGEFIVQNVLCRLTAVLGQLAQGLGGQAGRLRNGAARGALPAGGHRGGQRLEAGQGRPGGGQPLFVRRGGGHGRGARSRVGRPPHASGAGG
jgi:hypothetical protein